MTFARKFLEKIKDENTTLYEDGLTSAEVSGFIDTGCLILNALISGSIYGGMPDNGITVLAGASSTGKSFLALGILKHHLNSSPDAMAMYFDTEGAIKKGMLEERDIDSSRVIASEIDTVQRFTFKTIETLNAYIEEKEKPPFMIILDSLGMLSTTKESTDFETGKEVKDMTRAQAIRSAFRVITLKAAKAKVPVIVTNHTYQSVGLFPTTELSGGGGIRYSANTIIMLAKSKDKDGKEVVGNFIRAKSFKNRIAKENSEVAMKLSYRTGLDKYYGLIPIAEKYGIIKKVSTRYELPDGTKLFEKQIYADPDRFFTEDILNQIDEACKKEFLYGQFD